MHKEECRVTHPISDWWVINFQADEEGEGWEEKKPKGWELWKGSDNARPYGKQQELG